MEQRIEPPNDADIDVITRQLIHAGHLVSEATGKRLTGTETDLAAIQVVIDSKTVEPEATYSLRALGVAFGKVFIENNEPQPSHSPGMIGPKKRTQVSGVKRR